MSTSSEEEPSPTAPSIIEVVNIVQRLKDERDMWEARAEEYKIAFEVQTAHLREAIDLLVATQLELANECTNRRQPNLTLDRSESTYLVEGAIRRPSSYTLGSDGTPEALEADFGWQSSPTSQATFGHIEQLLRHYDFSAARREVDRLLPGHLSDEARVEGLLLKSAICRASGPDWLLEGLAQCSEALDLCDRISHLEFLLPKIKYHKALCQYMLGKLVEPDDVAADAAPAEELRRARGYQTSNDEEWEASGGAKRRSAFEEARAVSDGFLWQLKNEEGFRTMRHSSLTQRLQWSSKHPRLSLPRRWKLSWATT